MKCPVCGTENETGATFCNQCGSTLGTGARQSSTGPTVDLSRAPRNTSEPAPDAGFRPAVPAAPVEPLQASGGSRVYRVPDSSPPSASPYSSPPSSPYSYGGASTGTASRTSSMAIVALVLGVISFMGLFFIAGVGAIATGHLARREIRASGGQVSGGGLATAGLVLGYINVLLSILGLIGLCLLPLIVGAGSSFAP